MAPTASTHGHARDDTEQTILAAARELFMAHGYRAVSTRQIAEDCGLTQPALYHHFAGKEALYVAVLRAELARYEASLARIAHRDAPPIARLHHAVQFLLGSYHPGMGQMFRDIEAELSTAARAETEAAFASGIVAPLAVIVGVAQADGTIRAPDAGGMAPQEVAMLVLTLVSHFNPASASIAVAEGQMAPGNATDLAAQVVHVLLHGVAAP